MKNVEMILLLGLALGKNDEPLPELVARVDAAVAAQKEYGVNIMPCGGVTPGHTRTEADVMTELLLARGVAKETIIRENESRTTVENFLNAAKLLGNGKKRVLVVTSDYHVRRSVMTAMRCGLRAVGYPAVIPHDEAWKIAAKKEICYTVDLLMGWQDPGKTRPKWAGKLFDAVFCPRGK